MGGGGDISEGFLCNCHDNKHVQPIVKNPGYFMITCMYINKNDHMHFVNTFRSLSYRQYCYFLAGNLVFLGLKSNKMDKKIV